MQPNSQATLRSRERDIFAQSLRVQKTHSIPPVRPPGRRGQGSHVGSPGPRILPLCPQGLLVGSFRVPSSRAYNPTVTDFRMSEPLPSENFAFRRERSNLNKTKVDV